MSGEALHWVFEDGRYVERATRPCTRCDCAHDGSVPGFEVGECCCHRIGGSLISASPHEQEASGVEHAPTSSVAPVACYAEAERWTDRQTGEQRLRVSLVDGGRRIDDFDEMVAALSRHPAGCLCRIHAKARR